MLSDSKFLNVLETMPTFAKHFELQYVFPFVAAKTEDIGADLKSSNFILEAGLAASKPHFLVSETMLWWPEALNYVHGETPKVFSATFLNDKTLSTFRNADTVLLLRAGRHYLTTQDRPKKDFRVHELCKEEAQLMIALRVLFFGDE